MSHVYQPVMIMKLLSNDGKAKADEIALDLVQNDLSQLEYYTERVNQMVGKVLRNNQIVAKAEGVYQLIGFDELSDDERQKLIDLCAIKINEYKEKRGMMIWDGKLPSFCSLTLFQTTHKYKNLIIHFITRVCPVNNQGLPIKFIH